MAVLHRFYVNSSIAIILMGKRELVTLLNVSSWCLLMVERLFLAVLWGCMQFVIVVFPDHTHLLLLTLLYQPAWNTYGNINDVDNALCITSTLTLCRLKNKYPLWFI